MRIGELLARVDPPALTTEPLAIEQVGSSELGSERRAREPLDRFGVPALGFLALAHQRPGTRLDTHRPIRALKRVLRQLLHRLAGHIRQAAPHRSLDHLDQRPARPVRDLHLVRRQLRGGQLIRVPAETVT